MHFFERLRIDLQISIFDFSHELLGNFFLRLTHPSHDDYGKTKGDIEKCFFAFNCQLKKLNGEIFVFLSDNRFTGKRRSII
jgi:hypothetical protein